MKWAVVIFFFSICNAIASDRIYEQIDLVDSKDFIAECDAKKGDERAPFGLVYKDNKNNKKIEYLVMTGVYYDTCKDLEKEINWLRRKFKNLYIYGTEGRIDPDNSKNGLIFRFRAVFSPDKKYCYSYFLNDCDDVKNHRTFFNLIKMP